ncbi:MAG: hypothetical protein QOJ90_3057 [Actinomycetota bacterium]|jgi:hypothetical protein|nr:hypothetical protein [Actinomycetota bacterium]
MRQHVDRARALSAGRTALELGLITLAVWLIGAGSHAFTGFPKGYDAAGHLSKAQFILSNWPHISWNYEWYSGQPTFAGSYPPGYHLLLAFITWSTHLSLMTAMNAVSFIATVAVVTGLYTIVRAATGSRPAALLAAGLLLTAPTLWSQTVVLGLYPRFTALAFLAPAVALAIVHARSGGRLPALGVAALMLATLSMHPIVGALGLFLVAALHVLGPVGTIWGRIATAVGFFAGSLTLAAYFYLPMFLGGRSQSAFTNHETSLPWKSLVWTGGGQLAGLSPAILPLSAGLVLVAARLCARPRLSQRDRVRLGTDVVMLLEPDAASPTPVGATPQVVAYFAWHRRRDQVGFPLRVALMFAAVAALFLGYGFVGYLIPRFPLYINGLQPADLLVYPALLLAGSIGLVAGSLTAPATQRWAARRWVSPALVAGVLAAGLVVALAVPLLGRLAKDTWVNDDTVQATRESVFPTAATGQRQYRVAGVSDTMTKWVNQVSDTPQTKGYNDHGALQLDWQVWLEQGLSQSSASAEQRTFLLDWYGVKWVDTDSGSGDAVRQFADPTEFRLLAAATNYATLSSYEYLHPSPILSASNATSVLVLGDKQHYDLVLRALAYAGIDSRRLILVRGPAAVDDVTADELKAFDSVVLYGATVRSAPQVAALLHEYVLRGGGLMMDTADNLPGIRAVAEQPDSPFPSADMRTKVIRGPGWDWITEGDSLTDGADLNAFGAASFAGQNRWEVASANSLRPWAHAVLQSHGLTVVAAGTIGKGTVVWSGIGLPYHVDAFTSQTEGAFLGRLILATTGPPVAEPVTYRAEFVNSEHRRITVDGAAGGVLLKEQSSPNWHATVNGVETPIYLAGPGMMWVPLPAGTPGRVVVAVDYRLSTLERLGYLISILAGLLLLLLFAWPPLWHLTRRLGTQLLFGTSGIPTIDPPTVVEPDAVPPAPVPAAA